jgi:polysaccharide export outer membrane protein
MVSFYRSILWPISTAALVFGALANAPSAWAQAQTGYTDVLSTEAASPAAGQQQGDKQGPAVLTNSPLSGSPGGSNFSPIAAGEQLPSLYDSPDNLFTDYLLGPGDQIQVLVFGYEEFEGPRVVLPDGTVNMPLIGPITAAGKTLDDIGREIENRLGFYLTNPVVDTNLQVLRPVVVNVVGEVYRPGPIQLSSLTTVTTAIRDNATLTNFTNTPTLSTALTSAGGIRRTADIRDVKILRRLSDGSTAEFQVNLWDALQGADELGVLVMYDGDTVVVPSAPEGSDFIDQSLIARSSIAPTTVRVRVIGEVTSPGELEIQPNSSISSAIAAAGGHDTETAQLSNVKLVRLSDTGQIEEQVIDVSSLVDETQIQDGDVIFVPKRGGINALDNIARFATPILAPLDILNLIDDLFFNNRNN